jgi:hypothetical protein
VSFVVIIYALEIIYLFLLDADSWSWLSWTGWTLLSYSTGKDFQRKERFENGSQEGDTAKPFVVINYL